MANANGTTEIYEFSTSRLSSALLPHSESSWASEKAAQLGLHSEKDLVLSSREVPTVTLDSYCSSMSDSVDLL